MYRNELEACLFLARTCVGDRLATAPGDGSGSAIALPTALALLDPFAFFALLAWRKFLDEADHVSPCFLNPGDLLGFCNCIRVRLRSTHSRLSKTALVSRTGPSK